MLGFEIDKQTPFTAEQVCFDYAIAGRDAAQGRLHVDLHVIPRDVLREQLDALGFLEADVSAATPAGAGELAGVNFISGAKAQAGPAAGGRLRTLALASLLLFFVALYAPLLRHAALIEQLDAQVAQSREQALHAQALSDSKAAILERMEFLSDQRQRHASLTRVLLELTRLLPDDAWLERLLARDGELHLHGEAAAAAPMIQVLEESPYFEQAQFRSPVTRNNATNKDGFHISARLRAGAAE